MHILNFGVIQIKGIFGPISRVKLAVLCVHSLSVDLFFSPRHTKFLLMCFIVAKPSEMVASMMTIVFLPELIYKMYTTGS